MTESSCPDRLLLQRMLEEDLPEGESVELEKHLAECESCQQELLVICDAQSVLPSEPAPQGSSAELDRKRIDGIVSRLTQGDVNSSTSRYYTPRPAQEFSFLQPSNFPGSIGRLASYEVLGEVGRGGMGIILKAVDPSLQRTLAIKILSPQLAADASYQQRFLREARAAAAIDHNNVVTIHAVDQISGFPYIVMQYVEGESLADRLDRLGRIPVDDLIQFAEQLAAGLSAAHAENLVHRDLKPANILLEAGTDRLKISDFGLAKAVDDVGLTKIGIVAGTPEFMSPEQADGRRVDHRSDLFSLGTTLYYALSGRSPFRGPSTMATAQRVCTESPVPLSKQFKDVPEWLSNAVERLMHQNPEKRYQSAAEFAKDVKRQRDQSTFIGAVTDQTLADRPALARARGISPQTVTVALLIVCFLCFVAWELTGITNLTNRDSPGGDPPEIASEQVPGESEQTSSSNGQDRDSLMTGYLLVRTGQQFDSLAGAVDAASDGDTLEVHGDQLHEIESIEIIGKSLRVRSASRGAAVFTVTGGQKAKSAAITTDSTLVLEGLEFRWAIDTQALSVQDSYCIGVLGQGRFVAANCRFEVGGRTACIWVEGPNCEVRNCEFVGPNGRGIAMDPSGAGCELLSVNTVYRHRAAILVSAAQELTFIQLRNNSFEGNCALKLDFFDRTAQASVEAVGNIFGADIVCAIFGIRATRAAPVKERLEWNGSENRYASSGEYIQLLRPNGRRAGFRIGPQNLAEWKLFWNLTQNGSSEFEASASLTGSGADSNLVGPGRAYQIWKTSAAYIEWETRIISDLAAGEG